MITSKSNSRIKEIRLLKQAKHRDSRGEYFIEGVRLAEEALGQVLPVRKIVYSPRLEETRRGADLLSSARSKRPEVEWLYVSDEVMGTISDTRSHQGILLVLAKKAWSWEELFRRAGLIVILCELQDPGNLGTIFRVAEAGGGAGLVLSKGSIDPYNPKVVRASMGSIFRLPFLGDQDPYECLKILRSRGYRIWATAPQGDTSYWGVDFGQRAAVLFGQEGAGLPHSLIEEADGLFAIPMMAGVDSLNVAMAAGLVAYEAFRQKTVRVGTTGRSPQQVGSDEKDSV